MRRRNAPRTACIGLFCALLVGRNGCADAVKGISRRLLTTLPPQTRLVVDSEADLTQGQTGTLHAGVGYAKVSIDIQANGSRFDPNTQRRALFVPSALTQAQARDGFCAVQAFKLNAIATPYGEPNGELLQLKNSGFVAESISTLTFLMGGSYRLCYSDDGTFGVGHGDTVDAVLSVFGVFDGCATDGCLANKAYFCQVRKLDSNPPGSCALSYGGQGEGYVGTEGKATWSEAYNATFDADGRMLTRETRSCGATGGKPDENYIGTDGSGRFITPTPPANTVVTIPQTFNNLEGDNLKAFAVSACYCPHLSSCDQFEDFVQQIGVIYFFLSRVCADESCTSDYLAVLSKTPFLVKVECPPGACRNANSSRIKLIDAVGANDLPQWDAASGCRITTHDPEFGPSGNCQGPTDCQFDGGPRQDYKVFPNVLQDAYFNFLGDPLGVNYGSERYDLRHIHAGKTFDVCFCDTGSCSQPADWMNAGEFRTSPLRLVGKIAPQAGSTSAVEYALRPGILGFWRPSVDAASLGMGPGGLVKVLSDNRLSMNDGLCASTPYDASLVAGPSSAANASLYAGAIDSNMQPDRLVFNGGVASRTITVKTAGVIAICYCADAANGACKTNEHFRLAGRLTVRGPAGGQVWQFSTHVVSRISYEGWGLESSNYLRIILASASCSANNGNPTYQDPAVHIGCPANCKALNNFPGQQTNIETQVVASDKVGCDSKHEDCSTVVLTSIDTNSLATSERIQESATKLTFSTDPTLDDGDVLTFADDITGGSIEERATMRGVFPYADAGAGTYMVGLHVKRLSANTYSVPVGWLNDSTPSFAVTAGSWTRHNKGTTKEEILSTHDRRDLKVCWSPSINPAYAAEAGTVSFLEPPLMATAALSLASPILDQSLPMIISFETGAYSQYSSSVNPTQLRLLFTAVDFLQVHFAVGDKLALSASDAVVPNRATRTICGRLFMELWSSDGRGFPYPKSCYYGSEFTMNSVKMRELVIVFEPQSGLAASTKYQAVITATLRRGVRPGDELIRVFTMDDEIHRPYRAVELGRAKLSRTPVKAAQGATPQLAALELEGTDDIFNLDDHRVPLEVKLTGSSAGPITSGVHLRLILHPMTLWSLSANCVATCTASTSGHMQECTTEAVVANAANNIVRLKMPADLTPISGAATAKVALWGLNQPDSGFFPVRIAAQVTDANDVQPQYLESSGATLFKRARSKGNSVASVVLTDGNSKPFRGSTGNDLFLRVAFAATLFSKVSEEAKFVITLPTGYTCVSASAVQASLGILDLEPLPQRRGTLSTEADVSKDDGAWTFSDNTCSYKLWKDSVIYAGTIAYMQLTVDNPSTALPASDPSNELKLSLISQGAMTYGEKQMPEVKFGTPPTGTNFSGSLSGSVSVLGKLGEGLAQPMDLTPGARHHVQIFFRSEQAAVTGVQLHVDAPDKFDFGSRCSASDLTDVAVYLSGVVPVTHRLPGILGCTGKNMYNNGAYYNRAIIRVQGALEADSRYAFQVAVTNPASMDFTADMLLSWRLDVLIYRGHVLVDETEGPLDFQPNIRGGWGLYQKRIDTSKRFAITLSSYKPYSLTRVAATVTIFPIQVSAEVDSNLRIIAPAGYTWIVQSATAKYLKAGNGMNTVPGATADLPGGLPIVDATGSILQWVNQNSYDPSEKYGFICEIRVPDTVPPRSGNHFFIELGDWNTGDISERHEAGVVHALDVQALQDAAAIPAHSVEGMLVDITLRLRTITLIPRNGGLSITTPKGFDVPTNCVVSGTATYLTGLVCSATKESVGTTAIKLTASAPIPPGTHALKLTATNPSAHVNQVSGTTSCGYVECWKFVSLENAAVSQSIIDRSIAIPGYNVYTRMPQADLADLTDAQRLAIQQSNQPSSTSNLVVFFNLSKDAEASGNLRLVGPVGTFFFADCLSGVETRKDHVFGGENLWPDADGYAPWPSTAEVTKCEGNANIALLTVKPGLKAGNKYPWRIQLRLTPAVQPAENTWVLEYNGEASLPFASFDLWTFHDVALRPLTTAQTSTMPVSTPMYPVFLQFRPSNSVRGGVVILQAPQGFKFLSKGDRCVVQLKRLPSGDAGYIYNDRSEFMCKFDESMDFMLTLHFYPGVALTATSLYELRAQVSNPPFQLPDRTWMLQSWQSYSTDLGSAIDSAKVPGYSVVPVVPTWSVQSVPSDVSLSYNRGLVGVKVIIRVTTPSELKHGDILLATGPLGFNFSNNTGGENGCNQLAWETPLPHETGQLVKNLQTSISCPSLRTIQIVYTGMQDVASGSHAAFHIRTVNPRRTPLWTENYWTFEHRRGTKARSGGVVPGYYIFPVLEDTAVQLLGPLYAAQRTSTIKIGLRVVSACDLIRIIAAQPAGFDMSNAKLAIARTSLSGGAALSDMNLENIKVVATQVAVTASDNNAANSISVQLVASQGQAFEFTFVDVKLAALGGMTQWMVDTFTSGEQLDEQTLFGFRLPGLLSVLQTSLKNELAQELQPPPRAAEEIALLSGWTPRKGSPALAEFTIRFTNPVPESTKLQISTTTDYVFRSGGLMLYPYNSTGYRRLVNTEEISLTSGATANLTARLLEPLLAGTDYVILMLLQTAKSTASPSTWLFELSDGGELPFQTNDGQTAGFQLADIFELQASAPHAPPGAEFEVILTADVGKAGATILRVVPPKAYEFPSNCTAAAYMQCISASHSGIKSAYLSMTSGEVFNGTVNLEFITSSPEKEPTVRTWVVEGLLVDVTKLNQVGVAAPDQLGRQVGWGEDRIGFMLTPMPNIIIRYATVPLISTCLSITFEVLDRGALRPTQLAITPPTSYRVSCDADCLSLVSLPSHNVTCSDDPLTLKLDDGEGEFPVGVQVVTIGVRVPSSTPQLSDFGANTGSTFFEVRLLTSSDAVMDSNMQVPAKPVQSPLLQLDRATLTWSSSLPGVESTVRFSFRLKRQIPPTSNAPVDPGRPQPIRVAAVLLEMPPGFGHMIALPEDVRSSNSRFPLVQSSGNPGDSWVQYDSEKTIGSYFLLGNNSGNKDFRRVRILRDEAVTVPIGSYSFSFPVVVPPILPSDNVWYISLCSSVTCTSVDDASVVISFVIPGFTHGQDATFESAPVGAFACRMSAASMGLTLLLLVLLRI